MSKIIKKLIKFLDQLDLLLDNTRSKGCPNCGNYRLKFGEDWECPQSHRWCGVWDRLGKKQLKKVDGATLLKDMR